MGHLPPPIPMHVRQARLDGQRRDFFATDRIQAAASPGMLALDLTGYAVYPGLINSHDHLEYNHIPRRKRRLFYDNADRWNEEAELRWRVRGDSLNDALFIGGLKNLLCGALTVVHHGKLYKALERPDFPVSVLRRYGWAYSLAREKKLAKSYLQVERDVPWIVHLAEGVDEAAALEYGRLKKKGLVQPNTVIVHGVGLTADDMLDSARTLRGLVWCPSSNRFLLGYTANSEMWCSLGGRLALGSGPRLTADGDLLDEIYAALETGQIAEQDILPLVTTSAAALFDMPHAGRLEPGCHADWIALPEQLSLAEARRADLALIVRGGVPQIGDPALMARFPGLQTVPATLDGRAKAIRKDLAGQIARCRLQEPGLVIADRRGWMS